MRIDYPGFSGEDTLQEIAWDDWFQAFDDNGLAFLFDGSRKNSRFSKLVERSSARAPRRSSSAAKRTAAKRSTAKRAGAKRGTAKRATTKRTARPSASKRGTRSPMPKRSTRSKRSSSSKRGSR